MDNHTALCERTGINTRAHTEFRIAEKGSFLGRARAVEEADGELTRKLFKVVSELIQTMAEALEEDRAAAEDCVQHACSVLLSCAQAASQTANTAFEEHATAQPFRGGLAPWQVRRLTAHIDANLDKSLRCETLARVADLSVSHFARTFKYTFGVSPHIFLLRRRLERAQGLMLQSTLPLAQIATDCGFSDQAHFSRQFLNLTGESPGSWRRARACERG